MESRSLIVTSGVYVLPILPRKGVPALPRRGSQLGGHSELTAEVRDQHVSTVGSF